MAQLKFLDDPGDGNPTAIEISTINRPCLVFDELGSPQTEDCVRFDVRPLGSNVLAQFAGFQVKFQLTEDGTVLNLRGMFSSPPVQGGKAVIRWDACQWFESGVEKLYVVKRDKSHLALRINGEDHSKGRAWALGLQDPAPVFDTD